MGPDELHQPGHAPEQGGGPGHGNGSGHLGPDMAGPQGPAAEPAPEPPPTEILKPSRAGRNLRAAIVVGLILGAVALVSLFTVKVTFLIYVAAVVALGMWELARVLEARGIRLPLVPVAAGGAVMLGLAYYSGERALVAALGVTVIAVLAWRMAGGSAGYLRDVTAGLFTLVYLPLMASFVAPDAGRTGRSRAASWPGSWSRSAVTSAATSSAACWDGIRWPRSSARTRPGRGSLARRWPASWPVSCC